MTEYQTPKDRAYTDSLIKSAPKEAAAFLNLKGCNSDCRFQIVS